MDGLLNRTASLTAATPLEITFSEHIQFIGLALMSDVAVVDYKVNKEIVALEEIDSNTLDGDLGINAVNINKTAEIKSLWVISDVDCEIQWELRR